MRRLEDQELLLEILTTFIMTYVLIVTLCRAGKYNAASAIKTKL